MLLSRFITEVICPFCAVTGNFFQCLQSSNKTWPLSSCLIFILSPVFVSTGVLAQPLPALLPSAGKVLDTAPGPVPGAAAPQEGSGVGTEVLGDRSPLIPGSGAGFCVSVPTGASSVPVISLCRAVPQLPIPAGCPRGAGAGGSLWPLWRVWEPRTGCSRSFPLCSSATFAAPRAGGGDGGGRDCPCGSSRPSGREEGSGKNNPWASSSPLWLPAIYSPSRGEEAGTGRLGAAFDPFTAAGEGASRTFLPLSCLGRVQGRGTVVGSRS